MEHHYTAYTRIINNTEFYFVKKYSCFPEIKNASAVLESYGMHTNFDKACKIADIQNVELKQRLFKEANPFSLYGYNNTTPALSTSLRVELVDNKPSLVSRLYGIRKIITSKIPNWRLSPHS